jgi:hypothetical protein
MLTILHFTLISFFLYKTPRHAQLCMICSWFSQIHMTGFPIYYLLRNKCVLSLNFFLIVLGFKLRASCLLGRDYTTWGTTQHPSTPSFKCMSEILEIGSCSLVKLALNCDPPDFCLLSSKDYRYKLWTPSSSFKVWMKRQIKKWSVRIKVGKKEKIHFCNWLMLILQFKFMGSI